jgi:hypothetical protein
MIVALVDGDISDIDRDLEGMYCVKSKIFCVHPLAIMHPNFLAKGCFSFRGSYSLLYSSSFFVVYCNDSE